MLKDFSQSPFATQRDCLVKMVWNIWGRSKLSLISVNNWAPDNEISKKSKLDSATTKT